VGWSDGCGVVVECRDSGRGVPGPFLPRLFEDFAQAANPARDPSKGFGLGLSLARRTARQLGGDVALVGSRPGLTVFRFTMPDRPAENLAGR
jgi:signal transduction histidine kinase